MAVTSQFEIFRGIFLVWLVVSLGRVFLLTLEGRRLGRLVKARHPAVWKKERPMPWPLIMDQQYMAFILQRKYGTIEEGDLVVAYELLRTRFVRTMRFLIVGLVFSAGLALLFV